MDTDIDTQRTEDARMLRESLALVAPVAEALIASFYERLFADYPQVRSMFPANMDMQREKLLKAVIALVTHYDTPEALLPVRRPGGALRRRRPDAAGHPRVVRG